MQIEGHQRVAGPLHLADELGDLFGVKQQLAGAGRVRVDVGRGGLERRDVHADDEDLGAADHHVAFLDVGAPGGWP
jgi:hypothetical protein